MKEKLLTAICTLFIFVPWTILPLRAFSWALESPTAEIMISCYAAFMIFSGIFTLALYSGWELRNLLMKICLIINGIYTVSGICVFGMMLLQKIM